MVRVLWEEYNRPVPQTRPRPSRAEPREVVELRQLRFGQRVLELLERLLLLGREVA